jgi:hypothetical protein
MYVNVQIKPVRGASNKNGQLEINVADTCMGRQ